MVLKKFFAAVICVTLLTWNSRSVAEPYRDDAYRADEFLGLDLSKALFSPKPLGPATQFAPVAIEAQAGREQADRKTTGVRTSAAPKANSKIVISKTRMARGRSEKSHGAGRAKLARRHGNPLDAQAFDTRIQVWPCKSGGICNWQR